MPFHFSVPVFPGFSSCIFHKQPSHWALVHRARACGVFTGDGSLFTALPMPARLGRDTLGMGHAIMAHFCPGFGGPGRLDGGQGWESPEAVAWCAGETAWRRAGLRLPVPTAQHQKQVVLV